MQDKSGSIQEETRYTLKAIISQFPDKKKVWDDIVRLSQEKLEKEADDLFSNVFVSHPNRISAWKGLIKLLENGDFKINFSIKKMLGLSIELIPDKEIIWSDLIKLSQNMDIDVRHKAAEALSLFLPHISDKKKAWDDLLRLTYGRNSYVQECAIDAMSKGFSSYPDKQKAWDDFMRLTQRQEHNVKLSALFEIRRIFPYVPDKMQAWAYLMQLVLDRNTTIWEQSSWELKYLFPYLPDKGSACADIHYLARNVDGQIRNSIAGILHRAFPYYLDKEQAWGDLESLMYDKESTVRRNAISSAGSVYSYIPQKELVWGDLVQFAQEKDRDIRIIAYDSLGNICIHKAIETESVEVFKEEFDKALKYFETSSREEVMPSYSKFSLKFYTSVYNLIFNDKFIEYNLYRMKYCSKDSKYRAILLEIIDNVCKGIGEIKKVKSIGDFQGGLDAYEKYMVKARELLKMKGEYEDDAIRLVSKVLPIIEERVKVMVNNIQKLDAQ